MLNTLCYNLAYLQLKYLKRSRIDVTVYPDGRKKWEFYLFDYRWYWFEDAA